MLQGKYMVQVPAHQPPCLIQAKRPLDGGKELLKMLLKGTEVVLYWPHFSRVFLQSERTKGPNTRKMPVGAVVFHPLSLLPSTS